MEIELDRVLRAIRRYWWVVLVCMVAFGLVATFVRLSQPDEYTSTTTVAAVPADISGFALSPNETSVPTYIELVESDMVLTPVMDEFGIDKPIQEFRELVTVTNIPGTGLIRISVTDPDPQVAADLADAIAENFNLSAESMSAGIIGTKRDDLIYQRDQLDTQLIATSSQLQDLDAKTSSLSSEDERRRQGLQAERIDLEQRRADLDGSIRDLDTALASSSAPVRVTDAAVPATEPNGVSPLLLGMVGVVLGALVGAVLMLLLEFRDQSVRDEHHLAELTGLRRIMRLPRKLTPDRERSAIHMLAHRIAGQARASGATSVVLASPRASARANSVMEQLQATDALMDTAVTSLPGILDSGADLPLSQSSASFLIVEEGRTSSRDVNEVLETFNDIGLPPLGAALLRS